MEFNRRRGREVRKRTNNNHEDADVEKNNNNKNRGNGADSLRDATTEQSPKRLKTLRECRQSDRERRGGGDANQRRETPIEAARLQTHPSEDVREDEMDYQAMYSSQVR